MAQTQRAVAQACAQVWIGNGVNCALNNLTDISGVAQAYSGLALEKLTGEAYTHNGDYGIITAGKRAVGDLEITIAYSAAAEGYELIRAWFEATDCDAPICVRIIPETGSIGYLILGFLTLWQYPPADAARGGIISCTLRLKAYTVAQLIPAAYVAAQTLGVYYCDDLRTSPQVWSAVNTGLAATTVTNLWLEPTAPQIYQYAVANAIGYRRASGGAWTAIVDGTDIPDIAGSIKWLTTDRGGSGVIYAYGDSGNFGARRVWVLTSTDGGATWTATPSAPAVLNILAAHLVVDGLNIWRTYSRGTSGRIEYSANGGGAYNEFTLGGSSFFPYMSATTLQPLQVWTQGNGGTGGPDLVRMTAPAPTQTVLQDALNLGGVYRPDWMYLESLTTQYHLKAGVLRSTLDGWVTVNSTTALSPTVDGIAYLGGDFYCGKASGVNVTTPHHIYQLVGGALVGIAGADPQNLATVVSIPYNAGGICRDGVQVFYRY